MLSCVLCMCMHGETMKRRRPKRRSSIHIWTEKHQVNGGTRRLIQNRLCIILYGNQLHKRASLCGGGFLYHRLPLFHLSSQLIPVIVQLCIGFLVLQWAPRYSAHSVAVSYSNVRWRHLPVVSSSYFSSFLLASRGAGDHETPSEDSVRTRSLSGMTTGWQRRSNLGAV